MHLYARVEKFDGVLIETTRLAAPGPIVQRFMLDEYIEELYALDAFITVADAKHLVSQLEDEKHYGAEIKAHEQLAFAGMVLLKKFDLVPAAEDLAKIEGRIRQCNPTAPILRCLNSNVEWYKLLGKGVFDITRVLDFDPDFLSSSDHGHSHGEHDEEGHSHKDHEHASRESPHGSTITSCAVKFEGEAFALCS